MAKNKDAKVRLGADTTAFTREMKKASGNLTMFQRSAANMATTLGGMFAGGAILAGMRDMYANFEEQEKANRRLNTALRGNEEAFKALVKQANQIQSGTGLADDQIQQVQTLAAASGKTTEEIKKITAATVQWASVTGKDLQTAYLEINKSLSGTPGRLLRVDAGFAALSEQQLKNGGAIDYINSKYAGFAESSALVTDKLKANWDEIKETFGTGIAKVVNPALEKLNEDLASMNELDWGWADKLGYFLQGFGTSNKKFEIEAMNAIRAFRKEIAEQGKAFVEGQQWMSGYTIATRAVAAAQNQATEAAEKAKELEKERKKQQQEALERYKIEADQIQMNMDIQQLMLDESIKRRQDLNAEISRTIQLMTAERKPVYLPTVSDEEGVSDTPGIDTEKIFKAYQDNIEAAKNFTNDMNMILSGGLQEAGMVAAEVFADMLTGDGSPEDMFKAILDVFATFLKQMGAAILSYGIAMSAFKKAFTNPLAAIAAGIGLIVAGGVVSNLASRGPKAQGMADGGIVPMGYPNDTYPAMLTSGERVIPPGKLSGLGEMITVTGVLRAGDLYISSERGKYLNQRKG